MKQIIQALAETIIPAGGAFELGGGDLALAEKLEGMLRAFGRPTWRLGILLLLFDLSPILTLRAFSRFSRLDPERRTDFLARLESSRWLIWHGLFLIVKGIVVPLFYTFPEVDDAIGYKKA